MHPELTAALSTNAATTRHPRHASAAARPSRRNGCTEGRVGLQVSVFFTIGHSTRSLDEFVDLLRESGVRLVADVRSIPRSRRHPQFNVDQLPESLAERQIGHRHFMALGGRRSRQRPPESSPNTGWRVISFRNYADYALGDAFAAGLEDLRREGARQSTALMCAEAVWWRCHRRIITDYLLAAGETVFHILGPGNVKAASLTPGAEILPDRRVIYPADAGAPEAPPTPAAAGKAVVPAS